MRTSCLTAASLLGLVAVLAGCTQSGPSAGGVASWLGNSPGAKLYTGQGEMGTGTAGNSSGSGGPSQEAEPSPGTRR